MIAAPAAATRTLFHAQSRNLGFHAAISSLQPSWTSLISGNANPTTSGIAETTVAPQARHPVK
jgi:subtilase family serine protease